jgi:hypothetical protein
MYESQNVELRLQAKYFYLHLFKTLVHPASYPMDTLGSVGFELFSNESALQPGHGMCCGLRCIEAPTDTGHGI